eukprot:GHUV01015183.1.p1 GENE.GHUV01015183.1~~GHUV01015183.1.p1  ORF type:complete len:146 (+),score=27.24 GHUV01015183.1:72-509(+)
MALLMEAPEITAIEQLMLRDEDFPENYCNCAHPEDYHVQGRAISPEHIYNHRHGRHNRLILRISWQVAVDKHVPMSFVLDTGAPKQMYLCQAAMNRLEEFGTIKWDDDMGAQYVELFGRKATAPFFKLNPARHVLMSQKDQQLQA